jgi:general stress protein YciG
MNRNKQREIASKGGKAAHAKGTAHEWSREQAREAGRKGGLAARRQEDPDRVVDCAERRQHATNRITFACDIGAQKRRRTLTAETELQWSRDVSV